MNKFEHMTILHYIKGRTWEGFRCGDMMKVSHMVQTLKNSS